jgi:uncharacterized protein (DUF3084 family)
MKTLQEQLAEAEADKDKANADILKAYDDRDKADADILKAYADRRKADADLNKANDDWRKANDEIERIEELIEEQRLLNDIAEICREQTLFVGSCAQIVKQAFDALAQPVQEPTGERDEALAKQEERNFCPRCGKRTADLTAIHTCTPPQENT